MIFYVVIYGTNINTIINNSLKDVFVYHVLLKSFLIYMFFHLKHFFFNLIWLFIKLEESFLPRPPSLLKVAIKSKWICWLTSNDFLLVSRNSHNTHLAEHSMAQNLLVANSNWENCVNVATMFLVTVWVNGGGGIVNLLFRIIFYKNREYKNHQG